MTNGDVGSASVDESTSSAGGGPFSAPVTILRDTIPALSKNHRPFVVIVGLLMAAMAITPVTIGDASTVRWLSLAHLGLVAFIVALLFVVARGRAAGPHAGYERRQQAGEAVSGDWWQIILTTTSDAELEISAVTLMRVHVSVGEGLYQIMGHLFDADGLEKSNWHAEAVALGTTSPVELFYKWRGHSGRGASRYESQGDLTGIGTLRFYRQQDERRPCTRGDGWYGSGDVEKLEFGARNEMRLHRLTAAESRKVERDRDSDRRELVRNAYRRFTQTHGASPRSVSS